MDDLARTACAETNRVTMVVRKKDAQAVVDETRVEAEAAEMIARHLVHANVLMRKADRLPPTWMSVTQQRLHLERARTHQGLNQGKSAHHVLLNAGAVVAALSAAEMNVRPTPSRRP